MQQDDTKEGSPSLTENRNRRNVDVSDSDSASDSDEEDEEENIRVGYINIYCWYIFFALSNITLSLIGEE